jgi:hypothetical protein
MPEPLLMFTMSQPQRDFYRIIVFEAGGCTEACTVSVTALPIDGQNCQVIVTHRTGDQTEWFWVKAGANDSIDPDLNIRLEDAAKELHHA